MERSVGKHRTGRELQPLRLLHILFVDSDPNSRDRMQQALGSGFVVECAASVSDARLYLKAQPPDVLICEVLLGEENGLDLCRFVRTTSALRRLPIMVL